MNQPKFQSVAETLAAMREVATVYANQVLKCADLSDRNHQRIRATAMLDGICTAIEVVTMNGNYFAERQAAIERAACTKEKK